MRRTRRAALAMLRDHRVGQRVAEAVQPARRHAILEARDRRLRRQALAADRIAIEQQLVDRIVGQRVGIVGIGMPAGDPEDALGQQIAQRMVHARRCPPVGQAGGQPVEQPESPVRRLEQDGAAVRAAVRLVEGHLERPIAEVGKEDSLCYGIDDQQRRLRCGRSGP